MSFNFLYQIEQVKNRMTKTVTVNELIYTAWMWESCSDCKLKLIDSFQMQYERLFNVGIWCEFVGKLKVDVPSVWNEILLVL